MYVHMNNCRMVETLLFLYIKGAIFQIFGYFGPNLCEKTIFWLQTSRNYEVREACQQYLRFSVTVKDN